MLYSYSKKYIYIILRMLEMNGDARLISDIYFTKSSIVVKPFN